MKKSCARGSQSCDFVSGIKKKAACYLCLNCSPGIRHRPSSCKRSATRTTEGTEGDPTDKLEDLWSAGNAIPERKTPVQELLTGRKSLLEGRRWAFRNLSPDHPGEGRGLHLLHAVLQDTQVTIPAEISYHRILEKCIFKSSLGDFRDCHFSFKLQEAHQSQMHFKELHETLVFHIAGTHL